MGQRAIFLNGSCQIDACRSEATPVPHLSVFPTGLGWFGLAGGEGVVCGLFIGHASADEVREAAQTLSPPLQGGAGGGKTDANRSAYPPQPPLIKGGSSSVIEDDWFPELRRRIEQYAQGQRVEFDEFAVALPPRTGFQQRVIEATRGISYGQTLTYAELARQAGSPRAARAVGNVMACNRVPILVPCHRVVASSGGLGGFSAPQGVRLKERLLQMENAAPGPESCPPTFCTDDFCR